MFPFRRKTKSKTKRGTPHFKGEIIKRFPQEAVEATREKAWHWIGCGFLGLLFGGMLMFALGEEYRLWRTLDNHGQIYYAPLLKLEKVSCGQHNDTCYYATYRYDDTTQKQHIEWDIYSDLQGKTQVEIIAYGSTSRIVGTKQDITVYAILVCLASLAGGVLPVSVGVFHWLTFNPRPHKRGEVGLWPYNW